MVGVEHGSLARHVGRLTAPWIDDVFNHVAMVLQAYHGLKPARTQRSDVSATWSGLFLCLNPDFQLIR